MIRNEAAHGHTEVHVDDHQERSQQDHDQKNPAECRQSAHIIEHTAESRKQHGHKFAVCKHDQQSDGKNRQVDDGPQERGQPFGDDDLRRCHRQGVGQVSLVGKYIFVESVSDIYRGKHGGAADE